MNGSINCLFSRRVLYRGINIITVIIGFPGILYHEYAWQEQGDTIASYCDPYLTETMGAVVAMTIPVSLHFPEFT